MCGFTSGLSILFHWSIFLSLWSQALSLQSLQWSQWTGRWVLLCPFYYESQRMEVTFLGWSAIKLQDWDSSLTILTAKLTIIHYLLMPNWLLPSLFSSVQSLSRVRLFVTPWITAHQTSLSITNSQSLLKLMSIELVMPSNHHTLCRPLLLPPSIFHSIRVFSNESILHIRWPKYWPLIVHVLTTIFEIMATSKLTIYMLYKHFWGQHSSQWESPKQSQSLIGW